jgi:hypothetical protein
VGAAAWVACRTISPTPTDTTNDHIQLIGS